MIFFSGAGYKKWELKKHIEIEWHLTIGVASSCTLGPDPTCLYLSMTYVPHPFFVCNYIPMDFSFWSLWLYGYMGSCWKWDTDQSIFTEMNHSLVAVDSMAFQAKSTSQNLMMSRYTLKIHSFNTKCVTINLYPWLCFLLDSFSLDPLFLPIQMVFYPIFNAGTFTLCFWDVFGGSRYTDSPFFSW